MQHNPSTHAIDRKSGLRLVTNLTLPQPLHQEPRTPGRSAVCGEDALQISFSDEGYHRKARTPHIMVTNRALADSDCATHHCSKAVYCLSGVADELWGVIVARRRM
jgi:hypothetical protein